MQESKKFAFDVGITFMASSINMLFGFIIIVLLGRYLGPGDLGLYKITLALYGTMLLFAMIGIPAAMIKYVAEFKDDRNKINQIVSSGIITSLFLGAGLVPLIYFLSEIIAKILGVKYAGQTHNSQSLHYYINNPIAENLYKSYKEKIGGGNNLYSLPNCQPSEMDFNFTEISSDSFDTRLALVDFYVNQILSDIERIYTTDSKVNNFDEIAKFSKYLANIYAILRIFVLYKKKQAIDDSRVYALSDITFIESGISTDYKLLAQNWFAFRLKNKDLFKGLPDYIGKL